jgi:hypothetical protein
MKTKLSIAILVTLLLTLVMGAVTVFAQEPTTFFISVYHFLKGDEIDLSREAPVMIAVVKDGLTIDYWRMEYRQRVDADLPGGEYEFIIHDAETFDTLFTCGPYEFENGDDIRMQAHEQGPGRIPDCYVKFK